MLEICTFDIESSIKAEQAGAERIELCANKPEGGVTPSLGTIIQAKNTLNCPIYVMFRPRGGDFIYSRLEQEQIILDIELALAHKIDGVVVGSLLSNGRIDLDFMEKLKYKFPDTNFTFHRAFDRCSDPKEAIKKLISLGFENILTSGQHPLALSGLKNLEEYIELAAGKINIMVGSGVNPENIPTFYKIGIRNFHFSAGINLKSKMDTMAPNFSGDDGNYPGVNEASIRKARELIETLAKN